MITGGAGFVGSHLADRLVSEADRIVLLDNLSTGFMENIGHLLSNGKVRFVKGDVRNKQTCLKVTNGIDTVFHLGAQINPVKAVTDPFFDFDVNGRGTLNMLDACRRNRVKKFIFASTNVYGNPKHLPIDENHPIDLLSPYAASKLSGEGYCIVYNNTYGVKTVRLRFSNIYGPRQRSTKSESGVVPIFIGKAIRGLAPIIFGDGKQTRDFVYVTDVVSALRLAADTDGIDGEVFNIGSGTEVSVRQLADVVIRLTGKNLKPIYGPARAADFLRCRVNLSKARRKIGYRPTMRLREGLEKTIQWFQNYAS